MSAITQAALFCGGMGTRLRPLTDSVPKPMAPIRNGKPFLHYLLEQLSEQGIRRFVLMTGYLANVVSDYFGDGREWGWDITYSRGPVEWDTGRRLWQARDMLDERFLLLYSDNFAAFALDRTLALHETAVADLTIMLKKKARGNIAVGTDGRIERYDSSRSGEGLDHVELGYMIADRDPILSALGQIAGTPDVSFSAVLQVIAASGRIQGYPLDTPYQSISDPERLEQMRRHLTPKRILLVDRDGTIHRRAGRGEYILRWDQVEFLPHAIKGLSRLAAAGFTFVVISNQAAIGRGLASRAEVDALNDSIRDHLGSYGIEILSFEICPHHWTEACACRKPKPGLFFNAAAKFDLRLDRTLYIGDDPRDIEAAEAAGSCCLYVGIGDELAGTAFSQSKVYPGIDSTVDDILAAYARWDAR